MQDRRMFGLDPWRASIRTRRMLWRGSEDTPTSFLNDITLTDEDEVHEQLQPRHLDPVVLPLETGELLVVKFLCTRI